MKAHKPLSILLSLAILLSCIGWTPTLADTASPAKSAQPSATEPTQLPEAAEQEATRGKDHVARLHGEEGDHLNNLVFLNEDGSKTLYLYDHPVKYRDESGEIHDISLDIADTDDTAYPFRAKAHYAVTSFPAQLPDGITLTDGQVSVRMAAQIPSGNVALNHHARRVDTQTVAYTYDAHTTIEYALTYAGFKEEIVVSQYTGQTAYNFILYTGGLSLTDLGGAYYLTDATGEIKAALGQVIVFTADERNNTFGEMRAQTIKENQIYALTIVLDAAYLADPATAYPIRIDPTVTLTYEADGATAIEDVTIQSENVSYPEYPSVSVGLRSYGISRLLMRFPGIDFSDYEGVTITSATVSLRDLMCEETEMTVYCYPFTGSNWTESTASWSALTTQSWGEELDSQVISYNNGLTQESTHRYEFDISDAVQAWIDGTADAAKGIIFKASSTVETATTQLSKVFGSFEQDGYKPIFEMTYLSSVTISPSSARIFAGETKELSAATIPTGQPVTWVSSNPSVAIVESGIVTGISAGQTTITATLADGTYATCHMTVLAKGIILNYTNVDMCIGSTIILEAYTLPDNQDVTWFSNNEEIASVNATGVVTGKSIGTATITAQLDDGTCQVCIVNVKCTGTLNYTSIDVVEGNLFLLSLQTEEPINVTWTSSNTNVATVSNIGIVSGENSGTAVITASSPGLMQPVSCTVTVRLSEGIYCIENVGNSLCMAVKDNEIFGGSSVIQKTYQSNVNAATTFSQQWKICYLNNGYYSIRPAHKLNLGLYMNTAKNITVMDIGTTDSSDAITTSAQWSITITASGYVLQNRAYPSYTIMTYQGSNVEGEHIVAATISSTLPASRYTWNITKMVVTPQILLYDATTGKYLENGRRGITPGDVFTVNDLNIIVSVVSSTDIDFSVQWFSANKPSATVNADTGTVTGIAYGEVTITALKSLDGDIRTASYTLVVSQIPITGYELEYDPDFWNETVVTSGRYIKDYTNCYAYAINNQIDPIGTNFGCNYGATYHNQYVKQQPGEFYNTYNGSGDIVTIYNFGGYVDGSLVKDAVEKDFALYNSLLGTNIHFWEEWEVIPEGGYKVYLAVSPGGLFSNGDYHWYRQNPDGTWSHKQGTTAVTNLDANKNVIWDPKTAAELAGYTEEVGYFVVTPWNNLYEPTSAAQSESDSTIESVRTTATKEIVWTNSVEVGMSIDDVIELLGCAGEDIGSGTVIHKYATTDEKNIIISYIMDADGVFRVAGFYHQ